MGVICVDSGYELHIGGAAGLHVQATVLLCKLTTEEEVIEYTAAAVQLYREEAQYLHRMYKWLDAVGLDHVKARVVEDAGSRKALAERFVYSQKFMQMDPWAERASDDVHAHEFKPLAEVA